jgi:hypothetical protein
VAFGIIGVVSGLLGIALGAAGWVAPERVFRPTFKPARAKKIAIGLAVFGVVTVAFGVRQILIAMG